MTKIPIEGRTESHHDGSGVSRCDHTLHLKDSAGKPLGSWVEQRTASGIRVVCRYCQKFYGYRTTRRKADEDRLRQAYLEQQRRLACPGCGEEPFLG